MGIVEDKVAAEMVRLKSEISQKEQEKVILLKSIQEKKAQSKNTTEENTKPSPTYNSVNKRILKRTRQENLKIYKTQQSNTLEESFTKP